MSQLKSLSKPLLKAILRLAVGDAGDSLLRIVAEVALDPTIHSAAGRRNRARALLDDELARRRANVRSHLRNFALEAAVALLNSGEQDTAGGDE